MLYSLLPGALSLLVRIRSEEITPFILLCRLARRICVVVVIQLYRVGRALCSGACLYDIRDGLYANGEFMIDSLRSGLSRSRFGPASVSYSSGHSATILARPSWQRRRSQAAAHRQLPRVPLLAK